MDVTPHCSVLVCEWLSICTFYESEVINVDEDSALLLCSFKGSVRISAYTNQSRVSHSVRMRENSAEVYPKQSSLERSF